LQQVRNFSSFRIIFLIPFLYQISITRLTLQTLPNHDSVPFKPSIFFGYESTFSKQLPGIPLRVDALSVVVLIKPTPARMVLLSL